MAVATRGAAAPRPSAQELEVLRSFATRIDPWDAGAHNNLGVLYFTRGLTEEAVGAFTRALELDPRMTIAQRNLEIASFTSGYYDRRVEELQQRLAQSPRDRQSQWDLGRTWLLLGDVPRALDTFGVLLRENPDDVPVIRQVATAEAKCGDLEAATRWLHHALEVEPDNPSVLFQLGEVAYQRGMNEDARAALSRCVDLAPTDADALYLLGFVLGDQGDHEGATHATARALRLNPSLGRAQANLSLERYDARSYAKAREAREARGLADTVTAQLAHYNLGLAFRHKGYLPEALKEFRIALERGEDGTLVRHAMAEVYLLRGDMREALRVYDELLRDQPHNARFWNERGIALHHAGQYAEALASYESAIDASEHYAWAWNNLGVAAFHAGAPDRAVDAFSHARQLNASLVKPQLNLALVLVRQQEHSLALEVYRRVLRVAPEHAVAWNGVGLVLQHMKRFEDARNAFAHAVDANPDFAEAHYNLGFALSNLGDYAGALRETRRALELDAMYVPQKFELAMEGETADARLAVAPEVSGVHRNDAVSEFAFEASTLEQLFDQLSATPSGVRDADSAPYAEARALLAAGDHDAALAAVRRDLASGASRADGLTTSGDIYLARGAPGEALERYREARQIDAALGAAAEGEVRSLCAMHRFEEAVPSAEWLASHAPSNVDVLLLVARVRQETERLSEAHAALTAARRLAPMRGDVLAALARLSRDAGDLVGAIDRFREALALDRYDHGVRMELAAAYEASGAFDEADAELDTLVRETHRDDALLTLARLRRDRGRAYETIDPLASFLSTHPYHLEALASLGESLFLAHRVDDAAFAFARVRRFDPDHVAALYFQGVMLAREHRYDEALERWARVIDVEPSSPFARRARRDSRSADDLRRILLRPPAARRQPVEVG
jgi:tetratricopeptide (TPR) repeat protein